MRHPAVPVAHTLLEDAFLPPERIALTGPGVESPIRPLLTLSAGALSAAILTGFSGLKCL
jgi:hypothetical protein